MITIDSLVQVARESMLLGFVFGIIGGILISVAGRFAWSFCQEKEVEEVPCRMAREPFKDINPYTEKRRVAEV